MLFGSRTPHGVRGLKSPESKNIYTHCRRTPHGVRGLKFDLLLDVVPDRMSHPTRGAWIEITCLTDLTNRAASRTPHGVRGLKSPRRRKRSSWRCNRTPHGVRGLKSLHLNHERFPRRSHPTRGAWIEINLRAFYTSPECRRTPHGVRGLKSGVRHIGQ